MKTMRIAFVIAVAWALSGLLGCASPPIKHLPSDARPYLGETRAREQAIMLGDLHLLAMKERVELAGIDASNPIPMQVSMQPEMIQLTADFPQSGQGIGAVAQFRMLVDSLRHSRPRPRLGGAQGSYRNPYLLQHISLPHLSPEDGFVIGDHSFRSPAFIFANSLAALVVIPDIDDVAEAHRQGLRVWMDYDHPNRTITAAVGNYTVEDIHVAYRARPAQYEGQRMNIRLHVLVSADREDVANPYGMASRWIWEHWGKESHRAGGSQTAPFDVFKEYVTRWAFTPEPDGWADTVWQEFTIDGRPAAAPAFIVDVAQHPSIPLEERRWREPRSVWNQAWFSTQRCANGLLRYALQQDDDELLERAYLMTQVALAAPQRNGLFPAVYTTGARGWYMLYEDTPDWDEARWSNSDRRPPDATEEAYHIVDAAYTARLLLEWSDLVGGDDEAIAYVRRFAVRLADLQRIHGAFPGWVEPDGRIVPTLAEGPETAMGASLMLELAKRFPQEERWRESARRALMYLQEWPVREGRWEDFETYFSCSRWGADQVGKIVERNGIYKRNTLSMAWSAEAFLLAWELFNEPRYLQFGRRCLDELSLYQQVWDPPFLPTTAHGGFGVMNLDGEWNDARQSLFAPLYLRFYEAAGEPEYFERGVAALRASFIMMYCPENPLMREAYERKYPFFGPESYGFMMENVAHLGPDQEYIGPFTIFSWGNGAALEAAAKIRDMYGDAYIDVEREMAFGVNGCHAKVNGESVALTDRFDRDRLTIVYSTGERRTIQLTEGQATAPVRP